MDSNEENDVTPNSLMKRPGREVPVGGPGKDGNFGGKFGSNGEATEPLPELTVGQPAPPREGPWVSTSQAAGAAGNGSLVCSGQTASQKGPIPQADTGKPKPRMVQVVPPQKVATVHPAVALHASPQASMFVVVIAPLSKPM